MTKHKGKNSQEKQLSNEDVFKILKDAQVKYDQFLEISNYVTEVSVSNYEPVKRDINNPLTLCLK